MRFEVPQFIDIEDKIFGPLTWKQFIYSAGGVGVVVISWFLLPFIFFVLLAIPFAAIFGALAFFPINNRPFSVFLESVFSYFTSSRLYLWKRRSKYIPQKAPKNAPLLPQSHQSFHKPSGEKNLASLSRQLELDAIAKNE